MASLQETFAVTFTRIRIARGLTQEQLAARAGISVSYVSMLQRGQRSPPLETLEQLAKALGVKPVQLLGEPAR